MIHVSIKLRSGTIIRTRRDIEDPQVAVEMVAACIQVGRTMHHADETPRCIPWHAVDTIWVVGA